MERALVKEWVKALRSGEYDQANGTLNGDYEVDVFHKYLGNTIDDEEDEDLTAEGFCCLGVLCDISGLGSWNGQEYQYFIPHSERDHSLQLGKANGMLDNRLLEKLGLSDALQHELADLNDADYDFEQIAAYIEGMLL